MDGAGCSAPALEVFALSPSVDVPALRGQLLFVILARGTTRQRPDEIFQKLLGPGSRVVVVGLLRDLRSRLLARTDGRHGAFPISRAGWRDAAQPLPDGEEAHRPDVFGHEHNPRSGRGTLSVRSAFPTIVTFPCARILPPVQPGCRTECPAVASAEAISVRRFSASPGSQKKVREAGDEISTVQWVPAPVPFGARKWRGVRPGRCRWMSGPRGELSPRSVGTFGRANAHAHRTRAGGCARSRGSEGSGLGPRPRQHPFRTTMPGRRREEPATPRPGGDEEERRRRLGHAAAGPPTSP